MAKKVEITQKQYDKFIQTETENKDLKATVKALMIAHAG